MASAFRKSAPGAYFRRRLWLERLEERRLLASDMLNSLATDEQNSLLNLAGQAEFVVRSTPAVGPKFNLPVDGLDVADASTGVDASDIANSPPFALGQTFLLHSNPGATKVIYLDFNGHTTTGTQWNTTYNNGSAIVTPAYSFEGDSSFSDAELERIQHIWERIAEDYIPFNVDVTTEDPGAEALRDSGGTDTHWGVRVAIGGSSSDWFGSSAGGVAYVGSFSWNTDTPAFVFEEQLSNGNEKYTAEAVSHEAGHTLGLSHDGTNTQSYYEGYGSGATGWAPIMGVGYYEELSQWSKGEYPGANQTQDDLAIITGSNGFGYRADDYGSTIGTASALNILGTSVSNSGIIERTADLDYFEFSTGGATINLDINPFYRSPNLDILATLYNSVGSVIATSNPTLALGASFSVVVGAGTYYLSVDGTGKPAAGSDYGYSDYGSLGYYTIAGSFVETTTPGIDLYGSDFSLAASNLLGTGGLIDANLSVTNHGDTAAGAFDVKFYLSDDATIDPATDILLTLASGSSYYDSAEPSAYHVAGLSSLATNSATVRLTVPLNDPFVTDSQYYIGMAADADGNIVESNESNNQNLGDGIDRKSVSYSLDFRNLTPITIPANGAASAYPSNITITGLAGTVTDVNVSLVGITHTLPDDLDVLLVGPAGQKVILMSDTGGNSDITGVNLVLDDDAANSLPNNTKLASGSFKPTNFGSGDTFSSPAPAGPYGPLLSAFQGTSPNGAWSLYVLDDAANNSGSLSGGWGLTFTLSNSSPTNPANVALPNIDEDIPSISNTGSSVASIVLDSGSLDPDGSALGIAVTSTDNSHGQWQYSDNGGSSWHNLVGESISAARLLAPTYRVRFLPNADFNSQFTSLLPALSFKTWDQSFGIAGATADSTSGSAFSSVTVQATQSVTPINDSPVFGLANTLITVQEDAGAFSVNGFATNMAPGPASATDEAGQSLTFLVTVMGTTGTVAFDVAPSIDPLTGALTFTAAADAFGTATIEVLLRDNGSDVSPNISESAIHQFTIEVSATNDEQVVAVNTGLPIDQGAVGTITSAILTTTDIDTSPDSLLYTILSSPTHGSVLVNDAPALQFTQAQVNSGLVSYQNDGTANTVDSFSFSVDDGAGTASNGTFAITITTLPGDYNRDRWVDAADYVLWRKTLGATVPIFTAADGDGNGVVDQGDYNVWRADFGNTISSDASAGVAVSENVSISSNSTARDSASEIAAQDEGELRRLTSDDSVREKVREGHQSLDLLWEDVASSRAQGTRRAEVRVGARPTSTLWRLAAHCDKALLDWLEVGRVSRRRDDIDNPLEHEHDESTVDGESLIHDEVFDLLVSFTR